MDNRCLYPECRLIPKGFEELASLTIQFLKTRIGDYDKIKMEIKSLTVQIEKMNADLSNDPDLRDDLKKILNLK